jgi:hypothetical protein
MRERAQVHTMEAAIAALLLLASVAFALQMTAVTPLSASTSSQYVETQHDANVRGILASAVEDGSLRQTVLFWNDTADAFHNASDVGYYRNGAPATAFGDSLELALGSRSVAYNVRVTYITSSDDRRTRLIVYQGEPSENAARATRTVVLSDDARLYDETGAETSTTISDSNFYVTDANPDGNVYNVVRVEVVAWRV